MLRLALVAGLLAACGESVTLLEPPADAGPPAPPPERVIATEHGKAIWYGGKWHGRRTASGERFDKQAATAAHRTLPLGARVRVTNLDNGRAMILRINDRGPYGRDRSRVIDIAEAAAIELGYHQRGWANVKIERLADPGEIRGARAP